GVWLVGSAADNSYLGVAFGIRRSVRSRDQWPSRGSSAGRSYCSITLTRSHGGSFVEVQHSAQTAAAIDSCSQKCRLWCGTRIAIVYDARRTGASTYDWALARAAGATSQ